jgi:Flp pilus assembly protein TadD
MTTTTGSRCQECFADAVLDGVCGQCKASQGGTRRDRRALPRWTVVAERYLMGKVLGAGGFGITYLAKDTKLGRRIAIKEYFPVGLVSRAEDGFEVICNAAEDEAPFLRGLKRFSAEGTHLARFRHPNIVTVYDAFEANGTAYLVMEYLDGMTLKRWLAEVQRFEPHKALQLIQFILDALKAVHREHIAHRDLKPDNVYVTAQGQVMLLDFGGAKQLTSEGDRSMDAMFAQGYAAPEQYFADSGKVGAWTDVYGAAATLYHLLTGVKLAGALERSPERPQLDWQDCKASEGLRRVVEKAVSLKQSDRYQSVEALSEALAEVPATTPDGSQTGSQADGSNSASGGAPARKMATVGAALAVLVLSALGWKFYGGGGSESRLVTEAPAITTAASTARPEPVAPAPSAAAAAVDARSVLNDMLDQAATADWAGVEASVRRIRQSQATTGTPGTKPTPQVALADAAIDRGDYPTAVRALQRLVAEFPRAADAWAALGFALMRSGRSADAKDAVRRSLSLEADNASAWATMAEALAAVPPGAGSRDAILLAVYFSKDRPGMFQYLRQVDHFSPEFRRTILDQAKTLNQVPVRRP